MSVEVLFWHTHRKYLCYGHRDPGRAQNCLTVEPQPCWSQVTASTHSTRSRYSKCRSGTKSQVISDRFSAAHFTLTNESFSVVSLLINISTKFCAPSTESRTLKQKRRLKETYWIEDSGAKYLKPGLKSLILDTAKIRKLNGKASHFLQTGILGFQSARLKPYSWVQLPKDLWNQQFPNSCRNSYDPTPRSLQYQR